MSKIKDLFKTLEGLHFEFYKQGDKVVRVTRQADQNGHQVVVTNADGSQEEPKYVTAAEYEKLKSLPRVDANLVGPQ